MTPNKKPTTPPPSKPTRTLPPENKNLLLKMSSFIKEISNQSPFSILLVVGPLALLMALLTYIFDLLWNFFK